MSRGPVPSLVHRIMCGHRLSALRERSGMLQDEVARLTGFSQSKVGRPEYGETSLKPPDLDKVLDVYDVDPVMRREIHDLNDLGRKQPPRNKRALRTHFEGNMRTVIDLESSAATVWRHNSMEIPGVLQTERYMRNIFRSQRPSPTQEQIDQYTENRLARRPVLDNTDQQFWFVVHEAALLGMKNMDGDNAILVEQVNYLLEVLDRPNIELQVAPFHHGRYPGQQETYEVFGFDTEPAVQVTYVEKYDGGDILHEDKDLARFRTFWDHQRVHALGPEQTRPFLRGFLRSSS